MGTPEERRLAGLVTQTIKDYCMGREAADLSDHTLRCFVGMIETGEARYADFKAVGGEALVERVAAKLTELHTCPE